MRVGDVVEVHNWSASWDGVVALVIELGSHSTALSEFVFIRPILLPKSISESWPQYYERAGFYEHNLKVLGHIDVAQEGEKR